MNKKLLTLFFASSLLLVACGGGGDVPEEDVSPSETEEVVEAEEVDSAEEGADDQAIEIQEVVIDDENMKINFFGIVKYKEGDGEVIDALFEVENKSDTNYIVQARSLSLNDKMVDESFKIMSQEVAAGKSADAVLTIRNPEGGVPDLDGNIELILSVLDDSFETVEQVPVYVEF